MSPALPNANGWAACEHVLAEPLETIAADSSQRPFDAVVVGAGTAGVTAALSLVERGERVALLESGPIALLTHANSSDLRFQGRAPSEIRRPYEYAPSHAQTGQPFGMLVGALGGRSQFWQGPCPRMQPHEIADWPVRLTDLEPHYAWIEQRFRVTKDYGDTPLLSAITAALAPAGLPVVPLPLAIDTRAVADGWLGGTIGNAVSLLLRYRASPNDGAPPAQRNPRLAVAAFVARILLDPGGAARGVAVLDRRDGTSHEILAKRVLLAASAFESVRLALASEIPDRSGLLGHAIVDHLFVPMNIGMTLDGYEPHPFEPALAHVPSTPEHAWQLEVHAPPMTEMFLAREGATRQTRPYQTHIRGFAPVRRNPANHVQLLGDDQPGAYRVHLAYSEDDEAQLDEIKTVLKSAATALGAGATEPTERPPGFSYHEAGGLGMGDTSETSVTDPFGRFWHCPGLVACDASAWPTTGATNPHITIAAVSRRNALGDT